MEINTLALQYPITAVIVPYINTTLILRFRAHDPFRQIRPTLEKAFRRIRSETSATDFVTLAYEHAKAYQYSLALYNQFLRDIFPAD